MNNNKFSFKNFESKIISTNDFIKNDNVKSSIFFKKSIFNSILSGGSLQRGYSGPYRVK